MTDSETIALAAAAISIFAAAAAWGAILADRHSVKDTIRAQVNIAARSSRASVVSSNRQKWIDAIRDDIANVIAARLQISALQRSGSFDNSGSDALQTEERALRAKMTMLQARISMRLNHTEDDHLALISALCSFDATPSKVTQTELDSAGRRIFGAEWARLKKEASGINPFVKETT